MKKIGVLGAGSWGTALALLLYKNGHEVTLWSINNDEVEELKKEREHIESILKSLEIEDKKEIKIKKEMENIKEMQNKKELICRIAGLLFEKGLVSGKKPLQRRILLSLQYLHRLSEAQREI